MSNFSIGFYIDSSDPPTPAVDQVFVKEFSSKTVFVREVIRIAVRSHSTQRPRLNTSAYDACRMVACVT